MAFISFLGRLLFVSVFVLSAHQDCFHSYATGGPSVDEFWREPKRLVDQLKTENEESCTTYNMLKVSRHLFRWTKEMAYADYYERTLTNGVLSIQRGTEPGVMIYMLPLLPGASKAKSYHGWGTKYDSFWCCYGTAAGNGTPEVATIHTPGRKERAKILKKRKTLFDTDTVVPNKVFKNWLDDPTDLKRKRREVPHTILDAWRAYKHAHIPHSFFEPSLPFSTSFPKYTSSAAQRNLKTLCQPYLELVHGYSTGKVSELEACVQTNRDKFESDKNLGLVKQVVSSMYKRNIQRLTQTYLTLSLQDIANTVQLNSSKEAEMHVLQMIQEGEIYATINQNDGMVRFLEDPEQYKTCGMIERLDFSIQRIMMLSTKLTTMNEVMSCDPSYLGKVGRERQRFDFDDFDTVPSKFNI